MGNITFIGLAFGRAKLKCLVSKASLLEWYTMGPYSFGNVLMLTLAPSPRSTLGIKFQFIYLAIKLLNIAYISFQTVSPSQGSFGLVTARLFIIFLTELLGSVTNALWTNVFVATRSFILLSMMS